ncbi:phosphodiester glycosidase family protein [Paenibacillus oenotherae]|uniref:Phosphodiester glycosidase family protein n=1 Tax=Paenibacillus oenotherae TaxID=1435645 RepID=A0ABS7DAT0_9BACL|nr:phosphodiester glycosidase family protein [Paenibacillus oenotherae]MBW7477049.1 phosphodiester glycosidase family protein [Paenibacillus oenotherae]
MLQPGINRSDTFRRKRVKKRKGRFVRFILYLLTIVMLTGTLALGWLLLTPSGTNFRYLMADTLITTQHRHWAKYIIGQEALDRRVAEYKKSFEAMGDERDTHVIHLPEADPSHAGGEDEAQEKPLVEIKPISGSGYKGYLMIVSDPTKIRLGVPSKRGRGEKVDHMVKRTGAIAGVNGGGFADPNWQGNGFQPIGVVISQGTVYYDDVGTSKSTQVVGIDKNGTMVAGRYSVKEMLELGIREAVTFQPRIIVNGKGLIKNAKDGWGIAPRTAMGQREDGAILFVVIDGRQPGHSIGANLYDVQQIMLDNGAVIAANLDGGSSSVLVKDGEILNKPSDKSGDGRYLPTAFLVFEHPETVDMPNIWEGLRPKDIDAAKW